MLAFTILTSSVHETFSLNIFPLIKLFLSIPLEKFKTIIHIVKGRGMKYIGCLPSTSVLPFTYVGFVLRLANASEQAFFVFLYESFHSMGTHTVTVVMPGSSSPLFNDAKVEERNEENACGSISHIATNPKPHLFLRCKNFPHFMSLKEQV